MRALAVLIVSLALAAPASAGGWATAGLGPPPPGIGAGDEWNATVTILQHGQTPLVGVVPEIVIRNGKVEKRFTAKPTDKPGVYVAKVKFPTVGTWEYAVYDGFTQYGGAKLHTFPAIQVGAGGGEGGSSLPLWPFVAGGMALALAVALFLARRIRPAPAPAAQP